MSLRRLNICNVSLIRLLCDTHNFHIKSSDQCFPNCQIAQIDSSSGNNGFSLEQCLMPTKCS